jgi:hypothetical protein
MAPHDTGGLHTAVCGGVSETGPWLAVGGRRDDEGAGQSCDRRRNDGPDELVLVAGAFDGRALCTGPGGHGG